MSDGRKEYKHQWYLANRDRLKAKRPKYVSIRKGPLVDSTYDREYYLRTRTRRLEIAKAYRIRNADKIRAYRKARSDKLKKERE